MSYLYFFQAGRNGPIKIGFTGDPVKRFGALQLSSPWPLKNLGHVTGTKFHEAHVHHLLGVYRTHGEWFKPRRPVLRVIAEILSNNFPWPARLASPRRQPRPKNSQAERLRDLARRSVGEISPGMKVSDQIDRAAIRLGLTDQRWRVRAAWYGEAGSWPDHVYADFCARVEGLQ